MVFKHHYIFRIPLNDLYQENIFKKTSISRKPCKVKKQDTCIGILKVLIEKLPFHTFGNFLFRILEIRAFEVHSIFDIIAGDFFFVKYPLKRDRSISK